MGLGGKGGLEGEPRTEELVGGGQCALARLNHRGAVHWKGPRSTVAGPWGGQGVTSPLRRVGCSAFAAAISSLAMARVAVHTFRSRRADSRRSSRSGGTVSPGVPAGHPGNAGQVHNILGCGIWGERPWSSSTNGTLTNTVRPGSET